VTPALELRHNQIKLAPSRLESRLRLSPGGLSLVPLADLNQLTKQNTKPTNEAGSISESTPPPIPHPPSGA